MRSKEHVFVRRAGGTPDRPSFTLVENVPSPVNRFESGRETVPGRFRPLRPLMEFVRARDTSPGPHNPSGNRGFHVGRSLYVNADTGSVVHREDRHAASEVERPLPAELQCVVVDERVGSDFDPLDDGSIDHLDRPPLFVASGHSSARHITAVQTRRTGDRAVVHRPRRSVRTTWADFRTLEAATPISSDGGRNALDRVLRRVDSPPLQTESTLYCRGETGHSS